LQWEIDIENGINEGKANIPELREKYYNAIANGKGNRQDFKIARNAS
jgi:hypothetical protein